MACYVERHLRGALGIHARRPEKPPTSRQYTRYFFAAAEDPSRTPTERGSEADQGQDDKGKARQWDANEERRKRNQGNLQGAAEHRPLQENHNHFLHFLEGNAGTRNSDRHLT